MPEATAKQNAPSHRLSAVAESGMPQCNAGGPIAQTKSQPEPYYLPSPGKAKPRDRINPDRLVIAADARAAHNDARLPGSLPGKREDPTALAAPGQFGRHERI